MKRRSAYIFKAFFVLSALFLYFSLNANDACSEFYVISGSRGVGKEIKSLPCTISSPGFYYITKDLSCVAGSHGITITADNVTLDLMGFSLTGPGGEGNYDGIYMDSRANVEIRNGSVLSFPRHGIFESHVDGRAHRIINMRLKNNVHSGICLAGTGNLVQGCTAVANTDNGIDAGVGSSIIGNLCNNNTNYGIYLSDNSLADHNSVHGNGTNMNEPASCTFGVNHITLPD